MSLLESLITQQLDKQVALLEEQKKAFGGWLESEKILIDKYLVEESFAGGVSDVWEGALVRTYDGIVELKGKWAVFTGMCANEGLYLGNRVIRCKVPITLKSLAVEIKVEMKLSNNSEIWVLTRGDDLFDPKGCIVKIQKESDVDGTFVVFGSYIGNDGEFVFFKRQQIPEENENGNEEVNIEMRIKDNGDDRVFMTVKMSSMKSFVFQTYCNKFLPCFKETQIMILGVGRNIVLKKVSVQQKERARLGFVTEPSRRQHCCNII